MKRRLVRRSALTGVLAATGLMATACPPMEPPVIPSQNFTFKANSVTVNTSNDKGVCVLGVCVPPARDEPFVINIGFKVTIGQPNSATTQIITGDNAWPGLIQQGPGEGSSHTFTGGQQAITPLSNIPMLDVLDLAGGQKLTVAGVWSWGMEADLYSPGGITASANVLRTALNQFLAGGAPITDANQIVTIILNALGVGGVFSYLGANLGSIFFGDDAIGSKLYIGVGTRGALSDIVQGSAGSAVFPSIDIPVVNVPPDIRGGAIFSLGAGDRTLSGQSFTNGGVSGRHTYSFSLAGA